MKYMILLGDGMADEPLVELEGRTPIEAARTPNLDRMASRGTVGQFCPIPDGLPPGSDVGNLSLFGYDPRRAFRGRAAIEAVSQGIHLADDEVAFRCNLVTLEDGKMRDFTAGHISTGEGAALIATLQEKLGADFPLVFHSGVSYRHLTIVRASASASLDQLVALQCEPPHNITGQEADPYLPRGKGESIVHELIRRSRDVLADHPVNRARIAKGDPPATSIWLWGQGKAPSMEPYERKFGLTGAVVSAVDLVKGIGLCAGLEVLNVPGATGWLDTDYAGKVAAALGALSTHDFVYVHIEAPDETAHQGRADLKIQAIEDFDREVVGPCLTWAENHGDCRVLAAPDHFTLISTKTHAGGPVPFVLCGPGVPANGQAAYTERAAQASGILVSDGYRLVESMLRDATPDWLARNHDNAGDPIR